MGRGILAAAALLAIALIVYGVALVGVQFFGTQGLDGPCDFAARDPEGSTLSSHIDLWPPGYSCVSHGPDGAVASRRSDEVAWVSPFVIACLAGAIIFTTAGLVSARRHPDEV